MLGSLYLHEVRASDSQFGAKACSNGMALVPIPQSLRLRQLQFEMGGQKLK